MKEWRLDIDSWPGPDRKKWPGLRDVITESLDGRYVVVVYSCGEIDIYKEVGLFALLEEPKDLPRLLLRPRGLTCLVSDTTGITAQWIENRFCVVTTYCIRPSASLYLESSNHFVEQWFLMLNSARWHTFPALLQAKSFLRFLTNFCGEVGRVYRGGPDCGISNRYIYSQKMYKTIRYVSVG